MNSLTFDSIAVGDLLPPLVKMPTTEQLVRYAGAAADPARIHYDDAEARARGFDGVIVHGLLKAAFLGELVTSWCGDRGWVKKFSTQYRGVDRPGRPLICRGTVTAAGVHDGVQLVELEVWTENVQRQKTTQGTATVCFYAEETEPGSAGRTEFSMENHSREVSA